LIEPIRKVLAPHRGHYIQGKAVDVELGSQQGPTEGGAQRLLEVQLVSGSEKSGQPGRSHPGVSEEIPAREEVQGRNIYVPYDRLIVAVGAVTSTHGVPGLENAFHLKDIEDARGIRSRILDNLEIASLPTTTAEERQRLLSFVISGGGPTGVETASEIYDMLNEDVLDYFPKLIRSQARVHLIQSRGHILNTYSEKISEYAEKKFQRDDVDVILNARVKEVKPHSVIYTTKGANGSVEEHEVPSGMTLWSTGIAMSPFTKRMTQILPNQSHLKALLVDSHLRVKGTPAGSVYALGDASTIDTRLIDSLYAFVDECDSDHDGKLNYAEFQRLVARVGKNYPLATKHFEKVRDLFEAYDKDHNEVLSINEIAEMFLETQSKLTALPATAQTASQMGAYLGKKLNKLAKLKESGKLLPQPTDEEVSVAPSKDGSHPGKNKPDSTELDRSDLDIDDMHYRPFTYKDLGSLAYLGNSAAFDIPWLPESVRSFAGGLLAMYLWRSFYISEQATTRTRVLLMTDWIKRGIWGRDLSRI
jgi:NADH dehydrogenase FAD-containing subunit